MPLDTTKVLVGAGVFSIGDYVTAGGAGTLVDVGHIKQPYEIGAGFENFDITTERSTGVLLTSPLQTEHTIKVAFHQAEAEWLRIAQGQPAANKTGTTPNFTLRIGDRVSQYHQATLVGPGPGTTGVRTWTFWKLQPINLESIQVGKSIEQLYIVTFRMLRDDSVATADKFYKQVDA